VQIKRNYWGMMALLAMVATGTCAAQEPANPDGGSPPQQQQQGQMGGGRGQGGPRPLFGKITSIGAGNLVIARQDGSTVTVTLTAQTEFRKDREPAKVSDFKAGDMVMVRGDENADHTVTAKTIGGRSGGPEGGPGDGPGRGGPGGGGPRGGGPGGAPGGAPMGTLGKDYVAGEIKSIDAPKLTVLRPDGVTQTIELNEETSLHKGRESITMADIKVGDHVMARGAAQNGAFVPKGVMVVNPEQWQRMQQRAGETSAPKPADSAAPPAAPAPTTTAPAPGAQPQE
jgi:hypothetical protein